MRFTFTNSEISFIESLLKRENTNDQAKHLLLKIQEQIKKEQERSKAKKHNTVNATKARSENTRKKIENAINILRIEQKKITAYSIAKISGVSYTTVYSYKKQGRLPL